MKPISSAENPTYRDWLRLAQRSREQRARGLSLAEGVHLAQAALDAGVGLQSWLLRRGADSAGGEVGALSARLAAIAPGYVLAPSLFDRLSPVEQGAGLLLVVQTREHPLPRASKQDLVYLDGVQDPGNVGTLVRTAAAAGVGHVLLGPGCASAWSPRALRAGMGAQFRLRTTESVAAEALQGALDGEWVACVAHDAPAIWSAPMPRGAAGWAFGSEGQGVSAEAMAACAMRIRIPVGQAVESLNVAAAAAVVLFERRRRLDAPLP